jgi:hypothetical protein
VSAAFLLAPAPEVPPGEPVELRGLLKVPEARARPDASRLEVVADSGEVVTAVEAAFGLPDELLGPVRHERHENAWPPAAGGYAATWTVGGLLARARFSVRAGPAPRAAELRLLAVPGEMAPQLAFQFRGDAEHDPGAALLGSALVVDGTAHPHRGTTWDGVATVPAGRWTWGWLALEDYGVSGPAERVELRYGGLVAGAEPPDARRSTS